jgi:hypothetical protein
MTKCPEPADPTPCVKRDGPIAYGFKSVHNTAPICMGCERGPTQTGVQPPPAWDRIVNEHIRKQKGIR